jgi:hypothetical protein
MDVATDRSASLREIREVVGDNYLDRLTPTILAG